jgi:hypothetical protein
VTGENTGPVTRSLYGHRDGTWLVVEHAADRPELPDLIGQLRRLGPIQSVLAAVHDAMAEAQRTRWEQEKEAREAYKAALRAWRRAAPATRGTEPRLPDGIQPPHPGSQLGVQQQLADLIGVRQTTVSLYMRGKAVPGLTPDSRSRLVRLWFGLAADPEKTP